MAPHARAVESEDDKQSRSKLFEDLDTRNDQGLPRLTSGARYLIYAYTRRPLNTYRESQIRLRESLGEGGRSFFH